MELPAVSSLKHSLLKNINGILKKKKLKNLPWQKTQGVSTSFLLDTEKHMKSKE